MSSKIYNSLREVKMAEANSATKRECNAQEYRESWLNVIIDEILLECYEGLL